MKTGVVNKHIAEEEEMDDISRYFEYLYTTECNSKETEKIQVCSLEHFKIPANRVSVKYRAA